MAPNLSRVYPQLSGRSILEPLYDVYGLGPTRAEISIDQDCVG